MGTLPKILMILDKRLVICSLNARKSNAGPNVMVRYNKEGGYFVVFKKESMVNVVLCCEDQCAASP